MPRTKYEYDHEGAGGECKSPGSASSQGSASLKALRILDQTQVRSPKEATRNHNSNMDALKLLDEVAGGEKFKELAVPSMDLSPKQCYTDEEEVKEGDDLLASDNVKKYKSSDAIAKEKYAKYKALQLIDKSFGGDARYYAKTSSALPNTSIATRPRSRKDKRPEDMATTTRKKDIILSDSCDLETVERALKMAYSADTNIV